METINKIITSKKINDTCIVRFPGINKLNIINSDIIESEMLKLINPSNSRIVFDMQEIEFIDSTGFRLLLKLKKKASFNNIDLVLMYIRKEVLELFALLDLEYEFDLRKTTLKQAS